MPQDTPVNTLESMLEERQLVERAVAGDVRAFAELCERHRKRVWRVAASVTKSDADADDLAQEAFVRAFGAVRTYRPEASFAAWLCRIALNAAHDYQKSAWRRRVFFWSAAPMDTSGTGEESPAGSSAWLAGAETTPHREVERRELQRRVRAAVAQLKPTEATPIWMIYFEEFTLAEVARLEGEPESTVRSRVRAGLKRLEKMLGDLSPLALSEEEIGWGDTPGVRPPNHLAFAASATPSDRQDLTYDGGRRGSTICR